MSTIEVNEEWQAALQAIQKGGHVYITGAAAHKGLTTEHA